MAEVTPPTPKTNTTRATNDTRKQKLLRSPSSLQIVFAAIIAIALILAINFSSRIASGQPLQQTYDQVTEELDALRAQQLALIQERDFVRSDAYVEQWARSEGKLIRPGEVLYVPVPSAGSLVAAPPDEDLFGIEVETAPPEPDPWLIWWRLFFDTAPPEL
jgi:cell division protein FtsB